MADKFEVQLQSLLKRIAEELKKRALTSDVEELKSQIASAFHYQGSVETTSDLPSDAEVGDIYTVETADSSMGVSAGDLVTWNGESWTVLGGVFDINVIYGYIDSAVEEAVKDVQEESKTDYYKKLEISDFTITGTKGDDSIETLQIGAETDWVAIFEEALSDEEEPDEP